MAVSRFMALNARLIEPEIMDEPGLEADKHFQALDGIRRLNLASFSTNIAWRPILDYARQNPDKHLRVLDVASGGGDFPNWLASMAKTRGIPMSVFGCDMSANAVRYAQKRAQAKSIDTEFFVHDVIERGVPEDYDIVTCSLFLHHLSDADAVAFLKSVRASADMIVMNDLERCAPGLALAYLAGSTLSRSPIVRSDSVRSVSASFTRNEVETLARDAGLENCAITRHWPFRWRLVWKRS